MSDDELRHFLADVVLFGLGRGAGICARRFPDLLQRAMSAGDALEREYHELSKRADLIAKRPFQRAGGGDPQKLLDAALLSANAEGSAQVDRYERSQCESYLTGLEIMPGPNSETPIWRLVDVTFAAERRKLPKC